MTLKIHNTLTKRVEELQPLEPGKVSIYSCGPTVYDNVHIGNLSAFIFADTLRRTISASGVAVKHVMNFTDVDDKTIRRSRENYPDLDAMTALRTVTEEYGTAFLEDMRLVGNNTDALIFIKATDPAALDAMRQLVTDLYRGGFAYVADDGVYFSINAYRASGKTYGQLIEITESSTGNERIQNDEYDKESAHDFALWKTKKPGEPAWEFSLDGHDLTGRPGWHIECSAMSHHELGQPFDIHTGGIDLLFPHHENEIAQSTAGKADPVYASVFVHNEHILVDDKKMAKSSHNFYTLKDLIIKGVDPLAFRLLVLQSLYQKPTNFTLESAEAAHNRLQHWRAIAALRWQISHGITGELEQESQQAETNLLKAMEDNLNSPEALRIIDDIFSKIELRTSDALPRSSLLSLLVVVDNLLGLQLLDSTPDIDADMKKLIAEREIARERKDWAESDRLRNLLREQGLLVKDTASSSIWSYS